MKLIAPAGVTGLGSAAAFVRFRASDGALWHVGDEAFEAYDALHLAQYAIAAAEIGTTGTYQATDPADGVAGPFVLVRKAGENLVAADLVSRWEYEGAVYEAAVDSLADAALDQIRSIVRGVRGGATGLNAKKRELELIAGDTRDTSLGNAIRFELDGLAAAPEWTEDWTFKLFCVSGEDVVVFDDFELVTGDGDERAVDINLDGADYADLPETREGSYQLAVYAPDGFAVPLARSSPAYGKLIVYPNLEPAE